MKTSRDDINIFNVHDVAHFFVFMIPTLLLKYGTQFASATFLATSKKKAGQKRSMQFAYRIGKRGTPTGTALLKGGSLNYVPKDHFLLSVVDLGLYKSNLVSDMDIGTYRAINFKTIQELVIGGKVYRFHHKATKVVHGVELPYTEPETAKEIEKRLGWRS